MSELLSFTPSVPHQTTSLSSETSTHGSDSGSDSGELNLQ